jgi:hypothetical protein
MNVTVGAPVITPLPCPVCKSGKEVMAGPDAAGYEMQVTCYGCYDADCVGDPPRFVSRSIVGRGRTRAEAIEDWNEQVEDAQ